LPDASSLHLVQLAPPQAPRECHEPHRPVGRHRKAPDHAPAISPLFRENFTVDPEHQPPSAPTCTSPSSTPTRYSSPPSQPASLASSPGHRRRVSLLVPYHCEGPMLVSFLTSLPPRLIPLNATLLLHIFPHRLPPPARRSCQHCRRPMAMSCPTLFPYRAASLASFGPAE
jgi:hypothetical protein